MPLTTPMMLTEIAQSQSLWVASQMPPRMPTPALLQTTCTLPNTFTASSAACRMQSLSDTSTCIAWTRFPYALRARRASAR